LTNFEKYDSSEFFADTFWAHEINLNLMENYDKDYWHQLFDLYKESSSQFDKQILYISSGALGLTFSFIKDIVDIGTAQYKPMLLIGWLILIIVVLISLFSHYFSMKSLNQRMEDVEAASSPKADKFNKIVSCLNLIMLLALSSGILFIIIFTFINL